LQALDFHLPLQPGPGVKAARDCLRKHVAPLEKDRLLTQDLTAIRALMATKTLRLETEAVVGDLN
jgi:histidine ammonia-lyase